MMRRPETKTPALAGASVAARGSTQVSCLCSYLVVTVNGVCRFPYFRGPFRFQGSARRWFSPGSALRGLSPLHPDLCQPGPGYSSWSMRLIIIHYRHEIRKFQYVCLIYHFLPDFTAQADNGIRQNIEILPVAAVVDVGNPQSINPIQGCVRWHGHPALMQPDQ